MLIEDHEPKEIITIKIVETFHESNYHKKEQIFQELIIMQIDSVDFQEILKKYVSEDLLNGRLQIEAEDDLLGDGLVDSMGIMWLIAFIEEKFEINLPLEDVTIENFRTVKLIDAYLNTRRSP